MNLTPESLPTALDLLHHLPTLLPLTATPPTITLDTLDVLKRESRRRAHVLWVGPSQPEPMFSQINQIFRDEGFITDTRPLKLHMTLMNSTYRRPRTKRPQPFEYDAILRQAGVLECFGEVDVANTYVPSSCLSPVHAIQLQVTLHDIIRTFRRLRDDLPLEDDTVRVLVQNTPISVGCFPEIIQCPEFSRPLIRLSEISYPAIFTSAAHPDGLITPYLKTSRKISAQCADSSA